MCYDIGNTTIFKERMEIMLDKLIEVSNNEILFQQELQKIKKGIEDSKRPIVRLKNLMKKVDSWCEKQKEKETLTNGKDFELLPINHFCMYELNRYFKNINSCISQREKELCCIAYTKQLNPVMKKKLNEEFISKCYTVMEKGFGKSKFQKIDYLTFEFVSIINKLLLGLNLNIIERLINTKPLILLSPFGSEDYMVLNLNIVFLQQRKCIDILHMCEDLVNDLTENVLHIFLPNCFISDLHQLKEIYKANDDENLNSFMGYLKTLIRFSH